MDNPEDDPRSFHAHEEGGPDLGYDGNPFDAFNLLGVFTYKFRSIATLLAASRAKLL